LLIDARSRCSWDVNTGNQDTLCQAFGETDPNVLFSGLRNGSVLAHDIRSTACQAQYRLGHSHRHRSTNNSNGMITSIRCPRGSRSDANYIFTGTNQGEISMWDLRNRKPVTVFRTGVNLSTGSSKNPICLDDDLDFMYQGCDDLKVRFWSLLPWGSPCPRPFTEFKGLAPVNPCLPDSGSSVWSIPREELCDKDSIPRPIFSKKWQSPGQPATPLVITLIRDEVAFYRGF
jgi:WD40 repeat protein